MSADKLSWHVVTSQGRVVLAVYGSALAKEATDQAEKIEGQTGFPAWVETVVGERPAVGEVLPERRERKSKKKRTLTPEQEKKLIPEVEGATRKVRAAIKIERVSKLSVEMEKATERLNTSIAMAETALAMHPDAETDLDDQRVLALRSGKLVVDFFTSDGEYLQTLPLLHSPRATRILAANSLEDLLRVHRLERAWLGNSSKQIRDALIKMGMGPHDYVTLSEAERVKVLVEAGIEPEES